jgi:cytochrome c biogenesis protein CcmG/thiol:disulfide interchange protein DsbE
MIGKDLDGRVAIDLGVYGAPETFLIDENNIIVYRHTGPMTATAWNAEFVPRISKMKDKL